MLGGNELGSLAAPTPTTPSPELGGRRGPWAPSTPPHPPVKHRGGREGLLGARFSTAQGPPAHGMVIKTIFHALATMGRGIKPTPIVVGTRFRGLTLRGFYQRRVGERHKL